MIACDLGYRAVLSVEPNSPIRIVARQPVVADILRQTAADHGVSVEAMLTPRSRGKRGRARYDAMSRLRAVRNPDGSRRFSYPNIGRVMGGLHHTTVINGVRRWAELSAKALEAAE